jgi:sec-independent protein translocase protein TatB
MFDIGWSELLVIAVVALIVIGPKELPGVLRSVGYWMGKVRRMAAEFQGQFQEAMREAEMADLKKHADDLNEAAQSLTTKFDPMSYVENEAKSAIETPATPTSEASTPAGETAAPAVTAEPASISIPDVAMPTGIQTMAPPAPELPASEPARVASAPEPAIPAPEPPAPVAAPASQDRA